MYELLAIFALLVFLYSNVAGALEETPFGGALVFVTVGLALGGSGLDLLGVSFQAEDLSTMAELTLALVLFTDAADTDLKELARSLSLPRNLLLVGLPATILLGFLGGLLVFDGLAVIEIALLATLLAPTDAALGKAVVTDTSVPGHIRTGLNVESGLNDGICVPVFLALLAIATHDYGGHSVPELVLGLIVREIGVGLAVGICLSGLAAHLVVHFSTLGWITETWRQLPVVALALASFALAQHLGGSGFIASFTGGLVFGWTVRAHKEPLLLAAEGTGDTLALLTWVVFGASLVGPLFAGFTWQILLYAVLSLTLVRILPVLLALSRSGMRFDEALFVGWFGPRGLASIVFAVMVLDAEIPGGQTVVLTASCTILLSVVAHGLSARPLALYLAARERRTGPGRDR